MTQDELNTQIQQENVNIQPLPIPADSADTNPIDTPPTLDEFIPILTLARLPKKHITAVPTDTPKSFLDQIRFYDDGATQKLYYWENNAWHSLTAASTNSSRVRAHADANQTVTGASVNTQISFDVEDYDNLNEFNNALGQFSFTPSVDGYYLIHLSVGFQQSAAGQQFGCTLKKNGVDASYDLVNAGGPGGFYVKLTDQLHLTPSDTLTFYALSSLSSGVILGDPGATYVTIHRLS